MNEITSNEDNSKTTSKNCFTVKKLAAKNRENGNWPDSEAAIWALRAGSPENGIGKDVFLKIGRRVLVDEEKLWTAISNLQEARNVSGK
jgi:hypothetical protein